MAGGESNSSKQEISERSEQIALARIPTCNHPKSDGSMWKVWWWKNFCVFVNQKSMV
jgi:hypothetical protein